jgi:hypothetical protein
VSAAVAKIKRDAITANGELELDQGRRCGIMAGMTVRQIQKKLETLGVPADRSLLVATQLDKRAAQLAAQKKMRHDEAQQYLLELMAQGWAAQKPPA